MKKLVIFLLLIFTSCVTTSEKTQTEYFKDFQTQLLGLSQRIESIETKPKRDTLIGSDLYRRIDKIEDQLAQIEGSLTKLRSNPLFEGIETVKLSPAPTSSVITIKPEQPVKAEESPVSAEPVREVIKPAREEKKEREIAVPATVSAKEKVGNLYYQGYEMYSAGKFAQALSIFRNFIQTNPADALADNAQYWIAECYYSQKMFEKAIAEFKKVENYPDRNKVPDAYLKISYAYSELGNKEDAGKWKKLLLEKFKDSDAAKKVQ